MMDIKVNDELFYNNIHCVNNLLITCVCSTIKIPYISNGF